MSKQDRDVARWRKTGWVLYTILKKMGYLEHSREDRLSDNDLDRLRGDLRQVHADRVIGRFLEQVESNIRITKKSLDRLRRGELVYQCDRHKIVTEEELQGRLEAYNHLKENVLYMRAEYEGRA